MDRTYSTEVGRMLKGPVLMEKDMRMHTYGRALIWAAGALAATSMVAWAEDDPCENPSGVLTAEQIAFCFTESKAITGHARVDLPAVTFAFNSAQLTPEARSQLGELARALDFDAFKGTPFTIAGHTDAVGSDAYNQGLSERRADAVRQYLSDRGTLADQRMHTVGYGKSQLKPNLAPTAAGQRRVEIKLDFNR